MKKNFILFLLLVSILFFSELDKLSFAEQKPEVAALVIQQTRWTKDSFRKAEKRLGKVNIGVSEWDEFMKVMKMQVFKSDGKPLTVAMDGLIIKLGEHIKSAKDGNIQTYVFGYVDNINLLHEKYFVAAKDSKIIAKIRLDDYRQKTSEKFSTDLHNPQKDDYLRALQYVNKIKPGMWSGEFRAIMLMGGIWTGKNVNRMEIIDSGYGEFFMFAPGYLRDKYSQEEADGNLTQHFVFGYIENGNTIPGFIIHINNLQVTSVEYLTN